MSLPYHTQGLTSAILAADYKVRTSKTQAWVTPVRSPVLTKGLAPKDRSNRRPVPQLPSGLHSSSGPSLQRCSGDSQEESTVPHYVLKTPTMNFGEIK